MKIDKGGWSYTPFKRFPLFHIWKWGFSWGEGTNFEVQINHPNFYFVFGLWIGIKK